MRGLYSRSLEAEVTCCRYAAGAPRASASTDAGECGRGAPALHGERLRHAPERGLAHQGVNVLHHARVDRHRHTPGDSGPRDLRIDNHIDGVERAVVIEE